MPTTISDWVQACRASQEKYQRDTAEKEENFLIIAVFELLLDNQLSASSAANRVNEVVAPRLKTDLRAGVGFIWGLFADATKRFGATHVRQLCDFIVAIRRLADVVNEHGYMVTSGGKVIWREMPDFGWIFAEHGVQINDSDGFFDDEWHAQAEELLSSTILVATLMGESKDFRISMAYYARDAFNEIESPFDETRETADEWRMYLPPSEAWISIAGAKLYEICYDQSTIPDSNPYRWMKRYFNAERWALWKRRFAELAEQKDIDERCQGLAKRAAEKMKDVEQMAQIQIPTPQHR